MCGTARLRGPNRSSPVSNEASGHGLIGRVLIRDGQLWGAVVALFAMSIPNLAQMGRMAVKSDRPAVNLAVGFGLFVVISLLIILIMVGILLGVGRIIGS